MKIKIYLRDWFYNAGIIGFYRIFKEKDKLIIHDNYIELESQDLQNFANDYFEYFFNQYNIAEKTLNRIEKNFKIIKENLEMPVDEKEAKKVKDNIKVQKKYAKETVKYQLSKIKKIDEDIYYKINEALEILDQINEKEQIEQLETVKNIIKQNLEKQNINQRLTMNFFKSILSKSYFGQPSFLNVLKSSLSYDEQKQIMYKDYISNIIETGFLKEIIKNKYTIEEIKEIIDKKDITALTENIAKIYANIEKQIDKNKTLEQIKQYVKEKVFSYCSMCENEEVITEKYSESSFIPLAVSGENMPNFFWNQNINLKICNVCKLILFCIPAGITSIIKAVKDNNEYKEKEICSFINYDTNFKQLLQTNEYFQKISKTDRKEYNPYTQIILNIITQNKEISSWQLQNTFVVEFDAEYLAYSRMEYFNISKPLAIFFKKYAKELLEKIYNYQYRLQIVDYILKNKDIDIIINNKMRQNLKDNIKNNYDSYIATKVRMMINILKKGEEDMEEQIKNNDKKLTAIYMAGITTKEKLQKKKMENRIEGYIYKMLNCVKQGNKNEFMDIVIRIHITTGESVSPIFIEALKEKGLSFEDIGNAYIAGLASERYQEDGKGKEGEEKNG